VSEREKLYIESHYYHLAVGDLEKARQVYEVFVQTYPRDSGPPSNLSSIYSDLGQHEKALAEVREAIRLGARNPANYAQLAYCYLNLNRWEEAHAAAREAQAEDLDSPYVHYNEYLLAFLQGDAAGMARQGAWAVGKPGVEDQMLYYEAKSEAYFGRMQIARALVLRAVDSALGSGKRETAAWYRAHFAGLEADYGNFEYARRGVAAALALASTRNVQILAGEALGRAGDSGRSGKITEELIKRFPQDTIINSVVVPFSRAAIEIDRDSPTKAIEFLRTTSGYELVVDTLWSTYLRGG
jgi:eukaryotic-like serine/threonine-protein kinase